MRRVPSSPRPPMATFFLWRNLYKSFVLHCSQYRVTNAGTPDAFFVYDQPIWVISGPRQLERSATNNSMTSPSTMAVTSMQLQVFGSSTLTLGDLLLRFRGTKDFFVARLNELGTFTGVTSITGTGKELLGDVHIGSSHRLILTGAFSGPSITCGSTAVNQSSTLTDDFFVAYLAWKEIFITVQEQLLADESLCGISDLDAGPTHGETENACEKCNFGVD